MPSFDVKPVDDDAVLKEVWNTDEIEAKTELTSEQIENVNKVKTLAMLFNNDLLMSHANNFLILQKSKNRQSMREFTEVVKARREDFVNKGKGFFSSMMG